MKRKTRETALPRKRSAAALALQKPQHRQRVIPDKRRLATKRAANEEVREHVILTPSLRFNPGPDGPYTDIDEGDVGC